MGHPQPLYHLFLSVQTNITLFIANICEKCPSSIAKNTFKKLPKNVGDLGKLIVAQRL